MERAVYDRLREVEDTHWWFLARRRILQSFLSQLPLPAEARVLEVGCGAGGNLSLLKQFGEVTAIEPDAESRDYAAARSGVRVLDGRLPELASVRDGAYDLIAALDVIEHLDEDGASIGSLARLLAPGGYVVATVPAYRWLWSRHDLQHHHKRRYRRREFTGLFRAAGLEPVVDTYFNTLLFPVAASLRLLRNALKSHGDDDAVPAPWLNRTLATVMGTESRIAPRVRLPFGVSILVIARKSAGLRTQEDVPPALQAAA